MVFERGISPMNFPIVCGRMERGEPGELLGFHRIRLEIIIIIIRVCDAYRISVRRPRSEFHVASLLVEWEIFDVDLAEGLVDGRRFPRHRSVVPQNGFGHDGHLVVAVGATQQEENNHRGRSQQQQQQNYTHTH